MAKYTIELGVLVKSGYNVFDETWSTFVEEHKKELCDKIIRHYYFNEIGAETPDRFRHYLNEQLALEMPKWNKLYEAELWELFPLYNRILTTEGKSTTLSTNNYQRANRQDHAAIKSFGESLHRDMKDDKWMTFDGQVDTIGHKIGNLTGQHNEQETVDKKGTEDYTKHEDKTLDQTDKTVTNVTENIKEVMDDDTTGTTTGNESTTGHSSTFDSDTPQSKIASGLNTIDDQYLTNYQHTETTGSRNYSENRKGTDDKTTTTDRTTDTTEDLTRKITEDNTETMDRDTTEHTTRGWNRGDTEDTTEDWTEGVTTKNVQHDTEDQDTDEFRENREQLNNSTTNGEAGDSIDKDKTHRTDQVMGTDGVSRVTLLKQYRESLLNIDQMIIESLGVNFMGVF